MKLILLALFLLAAVARGATLGRVRRSAQENRSRRMSTQRRAKGSSGKGGLFSPGKGKGSNVFSKRSKSQCGAITGDLFDPQTDASDECQTSLLGIIAVDPPFGCSTLGLCDVNTGAFCLAGADVAACYDIGGLAGEVTVQVKAVWDFQPYSPGFECGEVLPYSAGPVTLDPYLPAATNAAATTRVCYDFLNFPNTIDPPPELDSTVIITLASGTGASYTGEILPGGTVCETSVANVNKSIIPFEITIGDQDFEGYIEFDVNQATLENVPLSPNLVLYEV